MGVIARALIITQMIVSLSEKCLRTVTASLLRLHLPPLPLSQLANHAADIGADAIAPALPILHEGHRHPSGHFGSGAIYN